MINPSKPYNIKPTLSKALFHPKYLLTWSGLLILFLLSKLPFKLTLLMGKILGLLLYLFAKKRRKIAEINLQLCFPKKNKTAIQNLTKKTFVNIGKGIFEMAIAWWASDLKIKKIKTSFQKKNILLEAANNNDLSLTSKLLSILDKPYDNQNDIDDYQSPSSNSENEGYGQPAGRPN